MTQPRSMKSSSIVNPSQSRASLTARLTRQQLEALSRCAEGISLRFDAAEIVDALIAGGYAPKNVAGVITLTAEGHQYLQTHAS